MQKIILADNQDITKAGWNFLLEHFNVKDSIHEVDSKKELISLLTVNESILVILDYSLFDFASVNELLILHERFGKTSWVICSDELSDDFIRTLLFSSTSFSVVMKDSSIDEFRTALREALRGNRYICNHVSNILLDNSKRTDHQQQRQILTITEQEILKEMAMGNTTKEIAAKRHVSSHTVMSHRKNIFRKIEVNNIHEATKYAIRAGIVDMTEYYI